MEAIGPTRTYFNGQQLKYPISIHNSHNNHNRDIPQTSRYSNSPYYSRTSSASGWDSGLPQHKTWQQNHPFKLGDDGLIPVASAAQERLWQIIQEHKVIILYFLLTYFFFVIYSLSQFFFKFYFSCLYFLYIEYVFVCSSEKKNY